MAEEGEEFRPRFGKVIRADGSELPIYYHPHPDDPNTFIPKDAKTDKPIVTKLNDTIHFDGLDPRTQAILVMREDGQAVYGKFQKTWDEEKEKAMSESPKYRQKDPNGWWKGLVTLFALGIFVLGMVWGIDAILSG